MFTYWYAYLLKLDVILKVGWSYLCYPPVTQGRSTECPPRRRRGARVADRPGGVGGAECDLEMLEAEIFWGKLSNIYQHTCLYALKFIYIYICLVLYVIYVYSRWLNSIYLHIHIIFEDGTYILYSMWLYIHSRFSFARWGNHLWVGCAKNHRLLKGAWKNDGFIVSSTYFFVMVFFTGDMNSKQPCFVFGVEIWWFYDLDVLIGVFLPMVNHWATSRNKTKRTLASQNHLQYVQTHMVHTTNRHENFWLA